MAQDDRDSVIDIRPRRHPERRKNIAEAYRSARIARVRSDESDENLLPETLALIQLADELATAVLNDQ